MKLRRLFTLIIISVMLLGLPFRSFAGLDDGLKVVRVGYFQYNHLLEGESEADRKSGYAYDLMQELASRNRWKYEYVYGSYAELYEMLRKGDIDLLPSTCYTEKRAKEVLFPDYPINTEVHYLVGKSDGIALSARDLNAVNGKTVGVITGSANEDLLMEFARTHGIEVNTLEFDKADEIWTALSNNIVDYIAGVDCSSPENMDNMFTEVCCTGTLDNFIAVAPQAYDLLAEMNESMKLLYEEDPYKLIKMQEKYFGSKGKAAGLTEAEEKWLSGHGTIRVGSLAKEESLIYKDSFGRLEGPSLRIFRLMADRIGAENAIEWKTYDSADALHLALLCGEVDIIDHAYHNYYDAENNGKILSDSFGAVSMSELRKANGPSYSESRIAVIANSLAESYVRDKWPQAEIILCDSLEDCLQKLQLDYAECVIGSSAMLIPRDGTGGYQVKTLPEDCGVCYSCRDQDFELVRILDKGIRRISENEIRDLYTRYQKVQTASEDVRRFAVNHKGIAALLVGSLVIVLTAILLLVRLLTKYRKIMAKNREYEADLRQINEKNEQLLLKRSAELLEKNKELTKVNDDIVEMLGTVVELRDRESGEHIQRVKTYSRILAEYIMNHYPKYHLSEDDVEAITTASAMHDMGKILIPDAVLQKPGRLTDEEYAIMKTHAKKGAEILENAPKSWSKGFIEMATEICLNHHEKWDGKGYPNGKKGDEIPISAQIVSVADCFDALTQDRVYRKAIDPEESFQMILDGKCGVFSPDMIACFKACRDLFINTVKNPTETTNVRHDAYSMMSSKLTGLRILIVDDDEFSRDLNRDILEEEGAVVTEAVNGKEALETVKANAPFDAILMDLVMPEMDGIEATAEIRKYEQTNNTLSVPIVALTADPREERARRCLEAGANACMAKPLVVSELTTILITFMKNRSKSMEKKLEDVIRIASTDPLTKVKSIAAYTDMIAELSNDIKSPEPPSFAVVMCDINRLKTVNDTYGHDMGDVYIKNAVQVICRVFSTSPVYRIGGDEFVVILQGIDYSNRNKRLEQLLAKEEEASKLESFAAGKASFAAGMAVYNPEKDYAVSDVVKRADAAMYSNKKSDRR